MWEQKWWMDIPWEIILSEFHQILLNDILQYSVMKWKGWNVVATCCPTRGYYFKTYIRLGVCLCIEFNNFYFFGWNRFNVHLTSCLKWVYLSFAKKKKKGYSKTRQRKSMLSKILQQLRPFGAPKWWCDVHTQVATKNSQKPFISKPHNQSQKQPVNGNALFTLVILVHFNLFTLL